MRNGSYLLACLTAALAWFVAETGGGLAFLAGGVRLWRYELWPVFSAITSPAAWLLAASLIMPLSRAFDRLFANRYQGGRRFLARMAFAMAVGPVLELVINDLFFRAFLGKPLYEYLFLPTFGGSGSLLSPLYYSTVLIHLPITDRLLPPCRPCGAFARERTVQRRLASSNHSGVS
jgi:hypothetical protein